jgi:hypothetical protein
MAIGFITDLLELIQRIFHRIGPTTINGSDTRYPERKLLVCNSEFGFRYRRYRNKNLALAEFGFKRTESNDSLNTSRGCIRCVSIRGSVTAYTNRVHPDPWYCLNTDPDPRIIGKMQVSTKMQNRYLNLCGSKAFRSG